MKKIGIINCYDVSTRCSSSGCFKAFNERKGSFKDYEENTQLISYVHCNGCSEKSVQQVLLRAQAMKNVGVSVIHLATCIKKRCPKYEEFMKALKQEYEVVGYSHGKKNE